MGIRLLARFRAALASVALLCAASGCGGGTQAQPGGLGSDCVAARDAGCASGKCLSLDSSTAYCSQACAAPTDCPDGYLCLASGGAQEKLCQSRGAGGVCSSDDDCPAGLKCDPGPARCYIPVTRSACGTCTSDKQCGAGGTCHTEAGSGEQFCAPACGPGDSCAQGFTCLAADDAAGARRCLPKAAAGAGAGTCRGGRPLCTPCTGDVECGKPGDLCVRNLLSEELFCGVQCKLGGTDCPASFTCTDLSGKGNGPTQCVPDSGTCAHYCDSSDPATVRRECGLGATCDLAHRQCNQLTNGTLCAACQSDDECIAGVPSARCIVNRTPGSPFQGERFCGSDCSSGTCPGPSCVKNAGACQAGFSCIGISLGDAWPFQCVPVSGSCQGAVARMGDACDRHGAAECQSGVCAQFGSEHRCSLACGQDADCGDPRWRCCKAVGGDKYDCTAAANGGSGICAPSGGSFGDDCAPGAPPCQEGLCLDLGTAQLCTRACDDGHACAAGFSCQQGTLRNSDGTPGAQTSVCFPDGGGGPGSACAFGPAACKSHLCLKKESGNVCTQSCTSAADCPATWSCGDINSAGGGQISVCLPPGTGP